MSLDETGNADLKEHLRLLTLEGLESIADSSFGIEGCRAAIARFDPEKDGLVENQTSFKNTVEALQQSPRVVELYGHDEATRIATQFVFNACKFEANGSAREDAFAEVWSGFLKELNTAHRTCRCVANIQNLQCSQVPIHLSDGITVMGRSFSQLSSLLNWQQNELERIGNDWQEGGGSSFVFLVETEFPKTPENFLLEEDGSSYQRATRTLLAMRLLAPGDINMGRLFIARPASFNVGIGGFSSNGTTTRRFGSPYVLTSELAPKISELYLDIAALEKLTDMFSRSLLLALRSFNAIYDRLTHQAEDKVVDAVTALEAVWGIDQELSYRLANYTSMLLETSDDTRVSTYKMLKGYYAIRSKVVHGSVLKSEQETQLRENEPLRDIVRRTLRAFVHLAVHPDKWTLERLRQEGETALLHNVSRTEIQMAMGILS